MKFIVEFASKSNSNPPKSPSQYLIDTKLSFENVRDFFHRGEFIFITAIENSLEPHYIKFESLDGNFLDETIDRFVEEDRFRIISKQNEIAFEYPISEDEVISIQVSDLPDDKIEMIKEIIKSEKLNEVNNVVNYRIGEAGASGYFINFLIGIGSSLVANKITAKLNDIGISFDLTSIKIKKAKKFLSKHYEISEDHIFLVSHHRKENQSTEVIFNTRRGKKTVIINEEGEITKS
ncbi:MAG: hypothetical protein ABJ387_14000 [Balneola sp.]